MANSLDVLLRGPRTPGQAPKNLSVRVEASDEDIQISAPPFGVLVTISNNGNGRPRIELSEAPKAAEEKPSRRSRAK